MFKPLCNLFKKRHAAKVAKGKELAKELELTKDTLADVKQDAINRNKDAKRRLDEALGGLGIFQEAEDLLRGKT